MNKNKWFSFFYTTRVKVNRGDTVIMNLSMIFALLAALSAPWVAVAGLVVALALGYRFRIERNSPDFCGDFDAVMKDAARNVQQVVDTFTEKSEE